MKKDKFSNRIRKNLLVFKILFQRDAANHYGGEFDIVHHVAARVRGEAFFHVKMN